VFEKRVLRRIFVPKREEVVEGWRTLHNEEFHTLHTSPNVIRAIKSRSMRWVGHVAHMGEMRNAYRILLVETEGRRLLVRPRCRWEDSRMDHKEIGWEGVDWMLVAQDR
jgi:hypothetical protein